MLVENKNSAVRPKDEAKIWAQLLGNADTDTDTEESAAPLLTPDALNVGKVAWQLAREAGLPRPRQEQYNQARQIVAKRQDDLLKAKPKAAKRLSNTTNFPFVKTDADTDATDNSTPDALFVAKNGRIANENHTDYLSTPDVSSSRLKALQHSEKHYLRYEGMSKKPYLTLGTNIHLHLVPNEAEKYVVADVDWGWNSKEATRSGINFFSQLTGIEVDVTPDAKHDYMKGILKYLISEAEKTTQVVSASDKEKIDKILGEVFSNELAMDVLTAPGVNELSLYWTDPETGINFKIRPDRLVKHPQWGNVLVSIKSAADVEPSAFEKQYFKYGYAISDAMYLAGLRHVTGEKWDTVCTIAVQNNSPWICQIYFNHAKDRVLRYGTQTFNELKAQLKECLQTNQWHGYEEIADPDHRGAIRLDLPMWVDFD